MKKLILVVSLSLFLLSGLLLYTSTKVHAQQTHELCSGANFSFEGQGCNMQPCPPGSQGRNAQGLCPVSAEQTASSRVTNLINDIVNLFSVIVGIVAVIMIIYGGFRYMTSGGDSSKVADARNTIIYAIVGLIIVAFAQLIVKFVLSRIAN